MIYHERMDQVQGIIESTLDFGKNGVILFWSKIP